MRFRFFGYDIHVSIAALAATECALFFLAPFAAVSLLLSADAAVFLEPERLFPYQILFGIATFVSFVAFGLYSARQRARTVGLLLRILLAVLSSSILTGMALGVAGLWESGRAMLAAAAILSIAASFLARALFNRMVDANVFKRRVLVYGAGARAQALASLRRRADRRGHVIVGFMPATGETSAVAESRLIPFTTDLPKLCRRLAIDEVVVAMDDRRREFPMSALLECRLAGLEVTELVTFFERETGRVRVDLLTPGWMIFGTGFKRGPLRRFTSRALDFLASCLILLISTPAILLTVLAIKIEDGLSSEVFYRQPRVGHQGRLFNLLKFRSMHADAEGDGEARWAQKDDPRATRVGALIRKLRIDELPQVLNVLRGHMSLVGPRPERPQFVEQLAAKIPYYGQRHSVKPGITGWAQLCYPYGSSEHDALQKLQYDLYYIKNNSLLFDLAILLQTAEVVFMGKGAR